MTTSATGLANPTRNADAARFGNQAKKTAQDVQKLGGMAKDLAEEKLGDLRDSALEYVEEGQERVQAWGRALEKSIRANPLKSVLIAVGIGLFVGRFCMRRR